ncbi:MAG: ZIP family metal transporter, partial [Oscillospiraceae bacterium]
MMLTVSLGELIPQAAGTLLARFPRSAAAAALTAACVAGMLSASLLDVLLPEGADGEQGDLRRLGIFSALAMLMHNLPEGIAVFMSASNDLRMGMAMALAIALHNIPEGILVAMPVLSATGSRGAALGLAALSGLAEPAGALLAWAVLRPVLNETGLALLYAAIAGLMAYLVFAELLPAAQSRRRPGWALAGTLGGVAVTVMSLGLL